MNTRILALQVGSLLWATVAVAPLPVNAADLFDDFAGSALDLSRWSIPDGAPGISVAGGLLVFSGDPDHKRVESVASFAPGVTGLLATAVINPAGDYQKFGLGQLTGPLAIYFDTYDDSLGENTNSIRTLVYSYSSSSLLFNESAPVSWGSFHRFAIEWLPSRIRFLIDGSPASEFSYLTTTESLPVGVWNDRTPTMQVDMVSVSAVPAPATVWLMAAGLFTLLGVKRTRTHLFA